MQTLEQQLAKIAQKLQPKIDKVLDKEVANAVRDEEIKTIKKVVYGSYSPMIYHRRGDWGGLADPANIEHRVENGRLHVWNDTPPNPGGTLNNSRVTINKYLSSLVEYGHDKRGGKYDFPSKWAYMRPRPFTAKTVANLKKSGKHVDALKAGLKRQGLDIN